MRNYSGKREELLSSKYLLPGDGRVHLLLLSYLEKKKKKKEPVVIFLWCF